MVKAYAHCRRLDGVDYTGVKSREVPPEIWEKIANFIPRDELLKLYTVNSAFLNVVLNLKYKRVDLSNEPDRPQAELRRKLDRLRNQFVAGRIRSLYIRPWRIDEEQAVPTSLRSRVKLGLKSLVDPEFPEFYEKEQLKKRIFDDVNVVLDAVAACKHGITEYSIDWDEQPRYHAALFSHFLSPLLDLAHNLQKLHLKVPVDSFRALFPIGRKFEFPELRRLQELTLTLSTGTLPKAEIDYHLDTLVVFIHNVFRTLKSLSIATTSSSEYVDLTHFFETLEGESYLHHFSLSIPSGNYHLSNPLALGRFLRRHRNTLRSLALRSPIADITQRTPAQWPVEAIKGVKFPELMTLHLALGGNSERLDDVIHVLYSCPTTLHTLLLENRVLPSQDVEYLISALDHPAPGGGVKRLRVTVKTLNDTFLDALFHRLPQLEDVEIVFKRLAGQPGDPFSDLLQHLKGRIYVASQVKRLQLEVVQSPVPVLLPNFAKNLLYAAFYSSLPLLKDFVSHTLP
ncbi:hypothetical protein PC9H_002182 [Pleurotus ostreatus]|uniref:F-box domain-containing protein n=1 Tax=Pleurotus ostreatus TaxID=5322 RepID=A0A8H6ZM26_PLEOS|nr:uncharacterized protein PC9H_002182 [Pleurotus ostreatus]KAF7419591.1 hypothetical protein PC9H_002182 [Pleurotus ostreatus]